MDIAYRHEWKHEISYADLLCIRQRLRAVAETDPHAVNGRYQIRSLYFDTPGDKALRQKIDGVNLAEEAQRIVDGDLDWMLSCGRPLLQELCCKMRTQGLRPRTIVDYMREPYIYAPGNVRVTFDYNIRTGLGCTDFLNPDCITIPAGDAPILLEVKWDAFLPSIIRDAVQTGNLRASAFSKYAQCRIYG